MAEAIGVVAGALSVLSAANTAYSRIDELLKSISNAPDTLQDLRRDVQQTRDLLAQVGESVPNLSRSTEFSLFLSKLGATTTRLLEALPAPDLQTRLARRTKLRVLRLEKEKLTRAADALLNNRHELQRLAQSPAILELQAISTHDFLQWLAAPEFSGVHKRLYENHVVGNIGHDVVDDVRFKSWVRTPGKALWYTGPAGSGKTLQFSVTVNFLGDKFRAPNFVGYIYFGVQDLEPVDIVCSLIKQFIVALHKPTIDNKLKEWYSRGKGNRSDYADATAILGHLMQQAPRAFLLFDAIDEFPGHTKELVHDLQMRMGRMRRNPPNVLLTSREQLVSEPLFEDAFKLEIRPRLDEISTFVSRELSKMNLSLLLTTEQENKLVSNIVSRASGSFLWAQLALGVLDPQSIHSEWKKVISIAQLQLGEFYTTILDRITHKVGDSYEMMLQILTWLTYSNTRLKRDELEAALGINTARARENTNGGLSLKQFVDVARPLVEEEYDGSVVLIHNSLKDYLHKWLPTQLEIPSLATTPDLLIARRCLNYLRQKPFAKKSLREVDEIQERLAEYPFLRYAAVNWGHHARKCCDKTLKDEIMAFLEAGFPMEAACLILGSCENNMEHYDEAYQRMTGIHLASAFGLHQVVEELLDTDLSDICSKTDGHWTAIHWASWKGYDRVITTILSKLKRSEDSLTALRWTTSLRCWTALHLAAKEGHLSVVKILHEYGGINIDVADLQRRTALYLACWGKHTPVVRFLMLNGADPNLQDAFGMTALHCAAKGGDLQLVKEILSLGHNRLNLNIADLLGHTSLDEAKRKGHDAIAQLLENLGATSSSKNASRPLTVNLAEFSIWKDIPRDTDWSCYELDPEITRSTRKGAQATCEVLRNSKDRKMMVFRKAFKSTTDLIMRGSETEHSKTIQKYSLSEGQILYTLWHPHIVLYLDSDIDPERNTFNLYLEYCDSGDLRSIYGLPLKPDDAKDETDRTYGFLDSSETPQLMAPPLNGVQLWGLIWQLSSALAYLHYGLSMQHESGQLKAVFECDWEYVIHRDVKPENGKSPA
ncbi:Pfs [Colletotrichum scovillei]|nr:Pfs [Colletotrichum scovillei]KAH8421757.1 Pfs [Colletotrichum scovillei]KAH8421909.1 Pfs [Colletotrichum scovillei]